VSRLGFHEVDALARQAVDLLVPEAELTITETPRNNAYVYPSATGGDHGFWRITVTIAPGNAAVLSLDPGRTPSEALADLVVELGEVTHGQFRSHYFPDCPGHGHAAVASPSGALVTFTCPVEARVVAEFSPALPPE